MRPSFALPAHALRRLAAPGRDAWGLAAVLALTSVALPAGSGADLWRGAMLALSLLLLATASGWRADRDAHRGVTLAVLLLAAALSFGLLPEVFQRGLSPVGAVAASLLALAHVEWRFAPDHGQAGWAWAFNAAARPALWAGLGAGTALLAISALYDPWLAMPACAAGAWLGVHAAELPRWFPGREAT